MKKYEAVCVFHPKTKEDKIKEVVSKIEKKIKDFGGKHEKTDTLGNRRLASLFQKFRKVEDGFYVVVYFSGEGDTSNNVSSQIRLIEEIMRHSIILSKSEEVEKVEVELPGAEKIEENLPAGRQGVESPQT